MKRRSLISRPSRSVTVSISDYHEDGVASGSEWNPGPRLSSRFEARSIDRSRSSSRGSQSEGHGDLRAAPRRRRRVPRRGRRPARPSSRASSGAHKQVVGRLVDELEELGYVERAPRPGGPPREAGRADADGASPWSGDADEIVAEHRGAPRGRRSAHKTYAAVPRRHCGDVVARGTSRPIPLTDHSARISVAMLFSTRAEYGVRLMVELGRQAGERPSRSRAVAESRAAAPLLPRAPGREAAQGRAGREPARRPRRLPPRASGRGDRDARGGAGARGRDRADGVLPRRRPRARSRVRTRPTATTPARRSCSGRGSRAASTKALSGHHARRAGRVRGSARPASPPDRGDRGLARRLNYRT